MPEPHEAYIGDGLQAAQVAFSPNSEWAAIGGFRKVQLRRRDGREPIVLPGEYRSSGYRALEVGFAPDGRTLVTNRWGDVRLWSVPEGRVIRETQIENGPSELFAREDGFFTLTTVGENEVVRFWPFGEGESRLLGSTNTLNVVDVDPEGQSMAYAVGRRIYTRSLAQWDSGPELVAEHPADVLSIAYHPDGKHLAASDESGEIRIWSTVDSSDRGPRVLKRPERTGGLRYSPGGKWLLGRGQERGLWVIWLWDMTAPPASAPLELRTDSFFLNDFEFQPDERWVVTSHGSHVFFWPLGQGYPAVLEGHEAGFIDIAFTSDGSRLLSSSRDGTLRAWPIDPGSRVEPPVLLSTPMTYPRIAIDPGGTRVVVSAGGGRVLVVPLEGGPARELEGFSKEANAGAVAISPDGRLVAAASDVAPVADKVIRVWDIESGVQQTVVPVPGAGEDSGDVIDVLQFSDQDHLLAGRPQSDPGLWLFDLRNGEWKNLGTFHAEHFVLSRSGRFGFAGGRRIPSSTHDQLIRFSLDGGAATPVLSHGLVGSLAMDSQERFLASAGEDGVVRIGPISGGAPHLFFGHKGSVLALAFSPDGRWLASSGDDRTIRLWRVPDVTQSPPHKRSHEDFLAMLRSWTNLRVVRDEASATGWRLDADPFPGWAKLPIW